MAVQYFASDKIGRQVKPILLPDTSNQIVLKADKWIAPDKAKHLMATCFSTIFLYQLYLNRLKKESTISKRVAVSFSLVLSVGKEILDFRSKENHFCKKDLICDAVGIITGMIIINQR